MRSSNNLKLPIFIVPFLKPEVFNIFIEVSIISLSSLFSSFDEKISIPMVKILGNIYFHLIILKEKNLL